MQEKIRIKIEQSLAAPLSQKIQEYCGLSGGDDRRKLGEDQCNQKERFRDVNQCFL
jgi:hypothetical protein